MGDPRKIRRKYSKPSHPWEGARIEEERTILKNYGLANKAEIWKMASLLTSYKDQTKALIASQTHQSKKELELLFRKLQNLGLLKDEASTDDILGLGINNVLERRLQTLVYRNKLARSMKQARQFILHGHISVAGKNITSPSYLVSVSDQHQIHFLTSSALSSIDHPERIQEQEIKELEHELHNLNIKHGPETNKEGLSDKKEKAEHHDKNHNKEKGKPQRDKRQKERSERKK